MVPVEDTIGYEVSVNVGFVTRIQRPMTMIWSLNIFGASISRYCRYKLVNKVVNSFDDCTVGW